MVISVTIIMMLALTASSFAGLHIDRLLLLWNCDEGKGNMLKDISGNGWDAIIKTDKFEWVDGKYGKGVQLQLAYAQVEGNIIESVGKTGEITMMGWFKMEQHKDYDGLITITPLEEDCCPYRLMVNPNRNPFWNAGHRVNKSLPSSIFELRRWYHYAMTSDGKTSKIYVDGKFRVEQAEDFKLPTFPKVTIYLGTGESPGTHPVENAIFDEAMIWDKVLSEDEIREVMHPVMPMVGPVDKLSTTWSPIKSAH